MDLDKLIIYSFHELESEQKRKILCALKGEEITVPTADVQKGSEQEQTNAEQS